MAVPIESLHGVSTLNYFLAPEPISFSVEVFARHRRKYRSRARGKNRAVL